MAHDVDLTAETLMLTGAGAYSLIYEEGGNLDVLAGGRLWSISNDLDFNGGLLDGKSFDDTATWVDPVVGKGDTFAALSLDDGKTWSHVRKLDGVRGYMSAAQAPNGVIHIAGTKQSVVSFNEAWLREGKPFADTCQAIVRGFPNRSAVWEAVGAA